MTLDSLQPKEHFTIRHIDDPTTRLQAIRMGLCEGTEVVCVERILGGPVIIAFDNQQLAIGRKLAQHISGSSHTHWKTEAAAVVAS